MAKLTMDLQINPKNPKPANMKHQRRFSTGTSNIRISTEQKPIPNYLKSQTGSCHDLCKFGARRDYPAQSISSKQDRMKSLQGLEARSNPNYPGKKKNPVVKPKSKRTLSSTNVRKPRNDAGKSVTPSRVSKSMSSLEVVENVPEKIIHVVGSSYEIQNDDHKQQEYDSSEREMIGMRRVASDGEINRKETVSTIVALRHQLIQQKLARPDSNAVIKEIATELTKMDRSRVKALVHAFEAFINS